MGPGQYCTAGGRHVRRAHVCVWQPGTPSCLVQCSRVVSKLWGLLLPVVCLQRLKQETDGRLLVEALVPDFQVSWWVGWLGGWVVGQETHSMCIGVYVVGEIA